MACTLHVAWDDRLTGYDFGPGHPLVPARVELTIELARAFGLFAAAGVSVERPAPATDAELGLVHVQPYIAAVRRAGGPEPDPSVLEFGLGTVDNPVFAIMHDASALVVGATLAAARAVWTGTAQHGALSPWLELAPGVAAADRLAHRQTARRGHRRPVTSVRRPAAGPTGLARHRSPTRFLPPERPVMRDDGGKRV